MAWGFTFKNSDNNPYGAPPDMAEHRQGQASMHVSRAIILWHPYNSKFRCIDEDTQI